LHEVGRLDVPPCVPASRTNDQRETPFNQRRTCRIVATGSTHGQPREFIKDELKASKQTKLLTDLSRRRPEARPHPDTSTKLTVEPDNSVKRPLELLIAR
jgi:hypothetical protein